MVSKNWVLSVGVNDYGEQAGLADLVYPVDNACRFYHVLTGQYGFEGILLVSKRDVMPEFAGVSQGAGTRAEIIDAIKQLRRKMGVDDTFVLFFSGHSLGQIPGYVLPFNSEEGVVPSYLMLATLEGELGHLPCRTHALFFDSDCMMPDGVLPNSIFFCSADVADKGGGRCSVSTDRICSFLADEVKDGETAHFFLGNNNEVLLEGNAATGGVFKLRRPGLRIEMPSKPYCCKAGEGIVIDLVASGVSPEKLEWSVTSADGLVTLPKNCVDQAVGKWSFMPEFAGHYRFSVCATVRDSGETAFATIDLEVEPAIHEKLSIDEETLSVCLKNSNYSARIPVRGNYTIVEHTVDGLPPSLSSRIDDGDIILEGIVPEHPNAGNASCVDPEPTAYTLWLKVEDEKGAVCEAEKRLIVFSLNEYCKIEAGTFEVGCNPTPEMVVEMTEMVTEHIRQRVRLKADLPKELQSELRQMGQAQTQQIIRGVLGNNPGSEVGIHKYYIRKYPVTNFQWREFIRAAEKSFVPAHWGLAPDYFPENEGTLPIVNISIEGIREYLAWRGTRLPTAWEWERAARNSDGRIFPWGNEFLPDKCNVMDSGIGRLTPVDKYAEYASPDGICDLAGNAAEWVERRAYGNIKGVGHAFAQPFRGGSFLDPCFQSLAFLDSKEAGVIYNASGQVAPNVETRFQWLGFRDVIDLDPEPSDSGSVSCEKANGILQQGFVQITDSDIRIREQRISVPAFSMSRYCVTNLEYWEFTKSSGHRFPKGWNGEDGDKMPFKLSDRYLPVVCVEFQDALAFCLWKSKKTGRIIRLPSSDQWLAAVRRGGGCYPWGSNDYDLQKCNSIDSGWGKRIPVFSLPGGRSLDGVFDLIGNVCEWVSTGQPRDLQGGSWRMDCQYISAPTGRARIRVRPDDIGFRYVDNTEFEEERRKQ